MVSESLCFRSHFLGVPFSAMIWIRTDKDELLPTIYIIVIGNLHGLFFTLYLLLILPIRKIFKWDDEDFVFALISAFFPFATIWAVSYTHLDVYKRQIHSPILKEIYFWLHMTTKCCKPFVTELLS